MINMLKQFCCFVFLGKISVIYRKYLCISYKSRKKCVIQKIPTLFSRIFTIFWFLPKIWNKNLLEKNYFYQRRQILQKMEGEDKIGFSQMIFKAKFWTWFSFNNYHWKQHIFQNKLKITKGESIWRWPEGSKDAKKCRSRVAHREACLKNDVCLVLWTNHSGFQAIIFDSFNLIFVFI